MTARNRQLARRAADHIEIHATMNISTPAFARGQDLV